MAVGLLAALFVGAVVVTYLTTLAIRRTLPTILFDLGVLAGAALAGVAALTGEAPWLPLATICGGLGYFVATRRELAVRGGPAALRVKVGDAFPDVSLKTTDGGAFTTGDLVASAPAMIVFYRGWWCPYCVTELRTLGAQHDELAAAGLRSFAVSVDPPEEQRALEARLGGRVRFLSDARGELLDAIGVRHPDGVPWYDRLLFGARRQDIAMPATVVIGNDGRISYVVRSRRIDQRPRTAEVLAAISRG